MKTKPPSELLGPLFSVIQNARLYPDSKSFADAVPKRDPEQIAKDWSLNMPTDEVGLRTFVETNFELPAITTESDTSGRSLRDYILNSWDKLTRNMSDIPEYGSALALPRKAIVPGGRFRELYYWDSYFTMLGLFAAGRHDLIEDMITNFGSLIDRYGHIPNGTRTYYLSRSHPPVFYLAAGLSKDQSLEARTQRLRWMRAEHDYWMDGADRLKPGAEHRRVVRLDDGSLLNRYWDDRPEPRDESWVEDELLATEAPQRNPHELWRDLRAAAESGWDFSCRWFANDNDFTSIRTTRLLPVDLNSLMYGLEMAIAAELVVLDSDESHHYTSLAQARADAINRHMWNADHGFYADFDLDDKAVSSKLTAAAAFPLFVRLASDEHGNVNAQSLKALVRPHGLVTTAIDTGQQWDAPNGWAPHQWVAFVGLHNYGQTALANELARSFIDLVDEEFRNTGQIFEKYDVVHGSSGSGGEYEVVTGFGWTNGVTLALMEQLAGAEIPAGHCS